MTQNVILGIHQPNYIPWLGYFYKLYQSDIFVFHDDAKFSESGAHNYHYIKTPQGQFRLKIPVDKSLGQRIMDIKTKDELGWKMKHIATIEHNYKRSPYFNSVFDDFCNLLLCTYTSLSELNKALIKFIGSSFGFETEYYDSSCLKLLSTNEQKIFDTCNAFGANVYFSGVGAKAYQNEENFANAGIILRYSDFMPFKYRQQWNDNFLENVSIIDYVMNCGYDWDRVLDSQKSNKLRF